MKSYSDIIRLVWPLALGMINNAVMQFADRAFLARHSMEALEAVLPASILAWVFMSFFQSLTAYGGVLIARNHGAGDRTGCRLAYRATMDVAAISTVATLPFLPIGGWILRTFGGGEALGGAFSYYAIVVGGSAFVYLQMAVSSYFTARSATRLLFWVNLAGNLLNVALDPLLIFGFAPFGLPSFGIAGAAWATVASLAAQYAALRYALHRRFAEEGPVGKGASGTRRRMVREILRDGIPSGGFATANMLSFTIFVFVTMHTGGDVAFAVSNAVFSVNYLLIAPVEGFALGAQTLVSQSLGAKDAAGAYANGNRVLGLALGFIAAAALVTVLANRPILALFAPGDSAVAAEFADLGFKLILLMGAWEFFDAADITLGGALKGAGDTRFVFLLLTLTAFLFWLPLVFAVRSRCDSMPALWATLVAYCCVTCFGTCWRWRRRGWSRMKNTPLSAGAGI